MRSKAFLSSCAALLVLGWCGLAQAEEPVEIQPIDLELDFAEVTNVQLDAAFERILSKRRNLDSPLKDPAGPTDMACNSGPTSNDLETCTVTASESPTPAAPARP